MNELWDTIRRHKAGEAVGIYSVCSAHPTILEAALRQAADDGSYVLIEATSNQVDQFGGYTGLRPADFRELVFGIADGCDFPRDRIVLGGDHLGPNRWQKEPAESAMAKAEDLVAAYVEAGYSKIHHDEHRHIGYGIWFLRQAISENGRMGDVLRQTLRDLLPAVADSLTPPTGADTSVLGASADDLRAFALDGLTRRLNIIGVPLDSL